MVKRPLISIITPSYNSSRFIKETYHSLLEQSWPHWEWCVVDDCSTDSTWDILVGISEGDKRVRLFKTNENSGAAVARNLGIDNSMGEYVAFLDSDDFWLSSKLELQLDFMKACGAVFSFTPFEIFDEAGKKLDKIVDLKSPDEISYEDLLLKKATFGCSTVLVQRDVIGDIRMPLIRTGQDYAFWLALLKAGGVAHKFNFAATGYRIVKGSISRNKIKKACRQWQIYRELEGLSVFASGRYFISYAMNALFRS